MKVHRYVITNVPIDKEREVIEILSDLIRKGIIDSTDIHQMEEEERPNG